MKAPVRLWRDGHASPALRNALNAGRADKGNTHRLAAIAAGLTTAGVPVAHATAAGLTLSAKFAIVAAVAGSLGGVGMIVQSRVESLAPAQIRPSTRATPPLVGAPAMVGDMAPAAPKLVEVKRAKPAPAAITTRVQTTQSPLAESLWLEDVRKLLPREPKQALHRLSAFRTRFENPVLDQEADLLKVEALVGSKQLRSARREYDAFIKRHPETPHRRRLEQLLNNPP